MLPTMATTERFKFFLRPERIGHCKP